MLVSSLVSIPPSLIAKGIHRRPHVPLVRPDKASVPLTCWYLNDVPPALDMPRAAPSNARYKCPSCTLHPANRSLYLLKRLVHWPYNPELEYCNPGGSSQRPRKPAKMRTF